MGFCCPRFVSARFEDVLRARYVVPAVWYLEASHRVANVSAYSQANADGIHVGAFFIIPNQTECCDLSNGF